MPTLAPITYRVEIHDARTHLFRVTLTLPRPSATQRLSLPVWIPGSYLVREFARHLLQPEASQAGRAVVLRQIDKTTWQAEAGGRGALRVTWLVYAFDTSVRTAFLDRARGFFNGTSLFLRIEGREREPHHVSFAALPRGWSIATAMTAVKPGHFVAADYDELVDHPFELGRFWRGAFKAHGVPHELVVSGAWPGFDAERLLADMRRICQTQIAFWHGARKPRAPFERYVFLLNAVDEGYGGLEHRASTALIARRRDLPQHGVAVLTEGHATLLGLISHEYFHAWNVKRLRPADLATIDYGRENYTELLWFFEGFTSYYDDLLLLRGGLIDVSRYLELLGKAINAVAATPGRHVQSVAQASFDAWVKYYRSDENTPNATVSYYIKGSLVALALDLTLRRASRGTLDAVMRRLWRLASHRAVREADIVATLEAVGGRSYAREIAAFVHGTAELPLPALLEAFAIELRREKAPYAAALGLRLTEGSTVTVKQVLADSPAARAGVSPRDELLAVNQWRLRRLEEAQQWLAPGAPFDLLVARDQRLLTLRVRPDVRPAPNVALHCIDKPEPAAAALRRAWLGR
jgi:predicted metalloprotease with PDZ domain